MLHVQVDAAACLGIFVNIIQQIVKHSPQMPAVRHDLYGLLRLFYDSFQLLVRESLLIFPRRL